MHFQWSNFSLWKSFDIFLILEPGCLIIDVHCLFGVFRSPRAFFTHMETSLLLVKARAVNFNLCSTPMAIELWGFFSVPNLLWHGASVYNGHLPGHVTLTSVASSVANTTCFSTKVCYGCNSNTQPSACEGNTLTHCAVPAAIYILRVKNL